MYETNRTDPIEEGLFNTLLHGLFDFSPLAICVSTTDSEASRYVKVNDAYLRLVGRSREFLDARPMQSAGAVIDDARRARRQKLLATVGRYELEEVEIRRADGVILSTLISAQRFVADGRAFDIEMIIDVTERKRAEAALWRLAHIDSLTGLPNRGHFIDALTAAVAQRSGGVLALAIIDIDFFKQINDNLGHLTGDGVLVEAASRLHGAVGQAGMVGRLGGDEFAVLVHDAADRRAVHRLFDEVGAVINNGAPLLAEAGGLRSTVTIGFAFMPDDAGDADGLMRAADIALYRGKRGGRAAVVAFRPEMEPRSS
ncbi:sensor domain-containing diguanylate cyclase [Kaistia geumhonensis]|uniref:Diguanylate cyclase (GGDEF)-like protein/PAS domain S-box-containing protein n=1 Tax=Kaistia geumhonensis TaxID=410839 RepID=A0ABU0MAK5_9HYPH|nr:sensor domain-containing diguanylate cyclase [Kaistia geumhonensis]MCX5480949.1 sensor domain-containing diguanylate cyclase [Kaistia geumhonensis]MDQ0518006.1 diguanylate cyclase (GGDEF)-like protein/PAS domain S-box-containing protein [Kaistia geumhonensis]